MYSCAFMYVNFWFPFLQSLIPLTQASFKYDDLQPTRNQYDSLSAAMVKNITTFQQQNPNPIQSKMLLKKAEQRSFGYTRSLWVHKVPLGTHGPFGYTTSLCVYTVPLGTQGPFGYTRSLWVHGSFGYTRSLWVDRVPFCIHDPFGYTWSLCVYTIPLGTHGPFGYTRSLWHN
jgi:hypothetical protein